MLRLIQSHVIERVLRGEVWSRQVVIAGADKKLHKRIFVEGVLERLRRVGEATALDAPVPLVEAEAAAEDVILKVRLEAQFAAHVLIEHRGVRWTDRAHAGVEAGGLPDGRA